MFELAVTGKVSGPNRSLLLIKTEISPEALLAVTRSLRPSLFKSPMITETGVEPVAEIIGAVELKWNFDYGK